MAGIKFLRSFSKRVPASSLVEVITAIIIISGVFSLSILIYINVQRSGFSGQRIKAEMRLQEILNDSTVMDDLELNYGDMIIIRYKDESEDNKNAVLISAEARTLNGKLLAVHKKVIYVEAD